ncbi:MAG: DUF4153 domain-containing protein [Bacteroidales bacterium]
MRAFDISYISRKIKKTFWRFPIVSVLIFITFFSSILVFYKAESNNIWQHLMMTGLLGIPLFTSLNLYLERVETRRWFNIIVNTIGFFLLFLFFINLPSHSIYEKHYIRAFVLFMAFFVSMFYLPFIGFHQQIPFWYYNKHFIKRIIISLFYSFIIQLGISLAIITINLLFDANIDYKWYAYVACFSYIFIFPWLVLVGLQRKFTFHAQKEYYPKELRTFVMYVLMPLNIIYAIILIAYILKIAFTGIWPSGWTVGLIFGYSIIELLIVIFLYPVLFDNENKLLLKYIYLNFILTIFFIIVLFLAIYKRISEYGLTENRMFVILFGIWMMFNVFYLLLKKINDLRVIPFSFLILAFVSVSGPWNVFRICKNQQLKRLNNILVRNDLIQNGKIDAKNKNVDPKTQAEISSIALYLTETHGGSTLTPYFKINADSLFNANDGLNYIQKISKLFSSVGLTYNPYYDESLNYIQVYTNQQMESIYVDSSLYLCILNVYSHDGTVEYSQNIKLNDTLNLNLYFSDKDHNLYLSINNKHDVVFDLIDFLKQIKSSNPIKENSNSIMLKPYELKKSLIGKKYKYDFILEHLQFIKNDKKEIPTSISGYLLIKKS